MGILICRAVCLFIEKLALFFLVIPAAVLGSAYLIGILFLTLREMLKK